MYFLLLTARGRFLRSLANGTQIAMCTDCILLPTDFLVAEICKAYTLTATPTK